MILGTRWANIFFQAILATMIPSKNELAKYWSERFYLGVLHCAIVPPYPIVPPYNILNRKLMGKEAANEANWVPVGSIC